MTPEPIPSRASARPAPAAPTIWTWPDRLVVELGDGAGATELIVLLSEDGAIQAAAWVYSQTGALLRLVDAGEA